MLYLRMKRRQDAFNMPPLATHLVDADSSREPWPTWIQSLAVESPVQKPGDATAVVPGRFDKLTNLLQRQVDHHQIAGAVALVLHRGKPVYSAALGLADVGEHRPMADDTVFRIASMTKPVTSVAILMLTEDDKLKLTDPVSKFLPEFKQMRVLDPAGRAPSRRARDHHS